MYGDPEDVRRAARRARSIAEELRRDAGETARLAEVPWRSTEADRWRNELEDSVASIRRDAETADALADALHAHAAACEATLATIAAARASFLQRVDEARGVLARAAEGATTVAVDQARGLVERARHLPAPTSLDWLNLR